MSKHTPGPWGAKSKKGLTSRKIIIVSKDGTEVTIANNEQDARLIAAAPELLEALKSIVGNRNQDARGTVISPSQLESAWDIIAKATKC